MPLWLRLAALPIAIALILWLPLEDVGIRSVYLLSAGISAWWAARLIAKFSAGQRRFSIRHIMVGAAAGIAVTPLALLLMAFKSGLHGHGSPDFTVGQMQAVVLRTPVWVIAGSLLGWGVAIARLALHERS
jgi:hypothetical protein